MDDNHRNNSPKTELRALVQETVLEFTSLRRRDIARKWASGWRPLDYQNMDLPDEIPEDILDTLQPLVDQYDPVVELSVMAADHRNELTLRRQANADAAQYLRPKLKSIEILEDPESIALQEEKNRMAHKMVDILEAMAEAKRSMS